jgi:hypothetical protein
MSQLAQAFEQLLGALDRLGIAYVIVGSLASSIHGIARATRDVDLVASIRPEHAVALSSELGTGFYADPEMIREAVQAGRSFNVIHYATVYKFDIFPIVDSFGAAQLAHRQWVESESMEGLPPRFAVSSAEDTLLAKLRWYHLGGRVSEQQWRDILGIVRIQSGRLDDSYLREWAARLDVTDLLDRALHER